MADDVVEKLTVQLDADLKALTSGVKQGVKQSEDELKKIDKAAKKAFDDAGKSGKNFASVLSGVVAGGVAAVTSALLNMASRGVAAFGQLASRALGLQSDLESARITFTNMFKGNEQAATAFINHLKEQSRLLKVNQSEAQQFAKSILPDASSVEEFDELLRLAAVGSRDAKKSLSDLIFTFNEAVSGDFTSMRDILDLPPDVLKRLREAKGDVPVLIKELNALFTKRGINDLSTFNNTLDTSVSNLKAFADDLLIIASDSGFDTLKEAAQDLFNVIGENRTDIENIARAIGSVADAALRFVSSRFIEGIKNLDTKPAQETLNTLAKIIDVADAVASAIGGINLSFGEIYDTVVSINPLLTAMGFSGDFLSDLELVNDRLDRALTTAVQLSALAKAEAARAKAEAEAAAAAIGADRIVPGMRQGVIATLSEQQQAQVEAAGQAAYNAEIQKAVSVLDEYNKKQEDRKKAQEEATQTTKEDGDALNVVNEILGENADKVSKADEAAAKLLDKYGSELLDLQEKTNEQLEQNAQEHGEEMLSIEQEAAEERAKAQQELIKDLAKLEKDIAKERSDIFSDAQEDLRKLASETDQKLKDEQQDFNREEKRDTEDHLKDMRRLRGQYLFDLEDALKARDARAIVDLRRRFDQEKSHREEDFETKQRREKEDQDLRLQQIREEERRRADEILLARERELQQLAEKEAEKRTQLETSYTEQIATINAKEEEKKQAEIAKYQEQQAELETALSKRLEAIAKELADEKDINEEGAAKILEALSEYFGADGEIDKLMEAFRERMDTKMKISVDFEGNRSPDDNQSATPSIGGSGQARAFASGGMMFANQPTRVMFGEAGPEIAQFIPLSQMQQNMTNRMNEPMTIELKLSGSAPPGIRSGDRDAMASTLVQAFRDAGFMAKTR